MAGRPITNHTASAEAKRERMRQLRKARRSSPPSPFNPRPLAQALQNWSRS